ncbi:MAG: TIGR04053 family radical SAM/SPASM domain-containing protein [Acidobacteriota bacterium]
MPHPLVRRQHSDRSERPFMIIWETTRACDLACRHCRAEAQPETAPGVLDHEEGRRLLEAARRFGRPAPLFIFTGGDPFKRADIFDLVRHAAAIGLAPAVSPSGTPLLTRNNLLRLKDAGAKAISLSVDAPTAAEHDDFRRVPGSFDLTLSGWQAARDIRLKVQLNTTVTRYNLHSLPRMFELVQHMGAMTWSLFFLVPTGRGQAEDEISPREYEAVLHFLYDASKYISAKTTEGHHYKRVVVQRTVLDEKGLSPADHIDLDPVYHELKTELDVIVAEHGLTPRRAVVRTPMHINSGDGLIFISQTGEVFPSGFLPVSAGNIRDRSLLDIYRNAPLFRDLRDPDKLSGRCGRCEFVHVCGGSRARAYATTGDMMGEEPFCTYEPGSFAFQRAVTAHLG